jgi:hypothetical protein
VGWLLPGRETGSRETAYLLWTNRRCVNNEYCVLFKKGAFDLGARVYPVAIKYNKIFVDAFWNSKRQSFSQHLYRLMTSWAVRPLAACAGWALSMRAPVVGVLCGDWPTAGEWLLQVVCDVWYMEPQDQQPGETAEAFAERVQGMICRRAGITRVKWDGMLKYYRPRGTLTEKRRAVRARPLCSAARCGWSFRPECMAGSTRVAWRRSVRAALLRDAACLPPQEFAREIMGEMGGAEREAAGTDGAEGARDGDDGGLKFRTNAAGGFDLVASAGPTD